MLALPSTGRSPRVVQATLLRVPEGVGWQIAGKGPAVRVAGNTGRQNPATELRATNWQSFHRVIVVWRELAIILLAAFAVTASVFAVTVALVRRVDAIENNRGE